MSKVHQARLAVRRALVRRAHDVTSELGARSVLVVAPHPDDETIGCAGRILLASAAGARVTVVVATDGADSHDAGVDVDRMRAIRRAELHQALGSLGVDETDILQFDLPDGHLAEHVEVLADRLQRLIEERRPDDVYATCADEMHPDHAATARALALAVSRVSSQPRLLEYPVWLWGDWPISRRHGDGRALAKAWRTYRLRQVELVSLDAEAVDQKRLALAAYASQLGDDVGAGSVVSLPPELIARALDGTELFFVRSGGRPG